jgi:hypothetical protein
VNDEPSYQGPAYEDTQYEDPQIDAPQYVEPDRAAPEEGSDVTFGLPAGNENEPELRDAFTEPQPSSEAMPQTDDMFDAPERDAGITVATAEEAGITEEIDTGEGPDISGVEYFIPEDMRSEPETETAVADEPVFNEPVSEPAAEESASGDEFEMAGVDNPAVVTLPDNATGESEMPSQPRQQFDSSAYTGLFTGVGIAEGMRLQLNLADRSLNGSFVDRRGQTFRIDGQLTEEEGHAQAMVISAGAPIGYMNLQLTNLGVTSLFVPLDENLSPQTASARQYEFLRTLSPAAQSRLEAERAAREAATGDARAPARNAQDFPGPTEEGLQEVFPGDDDEDE